MVREIVGEPGGGKLGKATAARVQLCQVETAPNFRLTRRWFNPATVPIRITRRWGVVVGPCLTAGCVETGGAAGGNALLQRAARQGRRYADVCRATNGTIADMDAAWIGAISASGGASATGLGAWVSNTPVGVLV